MVVVDPDEATVTRYRPGQQPLVVQRDGELDLDDVVAGFRCSVNDILE